MSRAARTIQVWTVYVVALGLILLFAPNFLLGLFGFPATDEVWVRIAGLLVLILGYYYYQAVRLEMTALFEWSVIARACVFVVFIVFVLLRLALPQLILFGVVDLAGALWTRSALRGEG